MDQHFPRWLRVVINKLDFVGLPNLGALLCGIAALAFVTNLMNPAAFMHFMFDPQLVRDGEWWRIFTFILTMGSYSSPLSVIFYCLYIYFVVNALESVWGAGPTTVFIILVYLCVLIGSFVVNMPIAPTSYMLFNIAFAFGTLFPDYELYIYFLFPVKAKWLAVISGLFAVYQFIGGDVIVLPIALIPYFLFFHYMLYTRVRSRLKVSANRKRFDDDMWR